MDSLAALLMGVLAFASILTLTKWILGEVGEFVRWFRNWRQKL